MKIKTPSYREDLQNMRLRMETFGALSINKFCSFLHSVLGRCVIELAGQDPGPSAIFTHLSGYWTRINEMEKTTSGTRPPGYICCFELREEWRYWKKVVRGIWTSGIHGLLLGSCKQLLNGQDKRLTGGKVIVSLMWIKIPWFAQKNVQMLIFFSL